MFDRTSSGSSLKWLAIIDEYTRECLALKAGRRIQHEDVKDVLGGLFLAHGIPEHIRSDNGPEFIAHGLRSWLERSGIGPLYISPGSPWENGYAESFNSRLRDEFLNCEIFDDVQSAQAMGTAWRVAYNEYRPRSALDYQTPGLPLLNWSSSYESLGAEIGKEIRCQRNDESVIQRSRL